MSTLCEQEKITTSLPPIGSMGLVYFTLDGWLFFLVNVVVNISSMDLLGICSITPWNFNVDT